MKGNIPGPSAHQNVYDKFGLGALTGSIDQ